ncbi:hypothetical protein GCM10023321_81880 [Pseudonocardia eucalypti]|uniref:Adenylate cyclase n=1 Tax=Pseudonocardia eucalypti TaxID=648755 RepID=A0ABP9RE84_9PSEU|nr:adenylate cyclase [Pseudonocardia eucalypti]
MVRKGRVARRRTVIDLPARLLLVAVILAANVAGTIGTIGYSLWVLPKSPGELSDPQRVLMLNLTVTLAYLAVSIVIGLITLKLMFRARVDDPRHERQLVLHGPLRVSLMLMISWLVGAVVFGVLNGMFSLRLGLGVAETVLVGGITTCTLCYLLAERILRRAASRVLEGNPPRPRFRASVLARPVLFWALGTGVPVSGLALTGLQVLIYRDVPAEQLAVVVLAGCVAVLLMGFLTTVGSARAVADPVRTVRLGMQKIERGELDVSVPVYDATELGQLQAGFNTMAGGLRERERIRELFGRQVGQDVAHATTSSEEVRLGGEVRTVAVLFVDLVGSTTLAHEQSPTEVVALLNQFFGVVVDVVEKCGGWINKFEGDAALAIFGAPNDLDNPAGRALNAARELAKQLSIEVPQLFAGVGVSAGEAVAGYVGGVNRYEYTVIGDPVNEAARLTELAKNVPGRVLAARGAVVMANATEARRWELGDAVTLRGRSSPTRLATPVQRRRRPPRATAEPTESSVSGTGIDAVTRLDPEGATAS